MPTLRPYQRKAVDGVYRELLGGAKRVLLVMPTGGGKTICAVQVMKDALSRGKRVVFLAHRNELIDQCQNKLREAGLVGVVVSTIQSLLVRDAVLPEADILIVDEAHTQHGGKIVEMYTKPIVIGLTATPVRMQGSPLGNEYDSMVVGGTQSELLACGAILPPVAFAPSLPSLGGVGGGDDYDLNELAEEMLKPAVVGNVVDTWEKLGNDEQTVVFAVNKAHAMGLAIEFDKRGIPTHTIFGNTPMVRRAQSVAMFRAGMYPVLVNVGVFTEGFDVPEVRNIVLARPTKSLALYMQMCGRGCRPADGKASYRLFDHGLNILTHGLPTIDRPWSLTKKPPTPPAIEAGMYVCPNYHVLEKRMVCPYCQAEAPEDSRSVRVVDGELVVVDDAYLAGSAVLRRKEEETRRRRHLFAKGAGAGMKGSELTRWVNRKMEAEEFGPRGSGGNTYGHMNREIK